MSRSLLFAPHFRRIYAARIVSELGDFAALLALPLLVLSRTGSFAWAGIAVSAPLLAQVAGLATGTMGDRFHRGRLMIVCDLIRAGAYASIALFASSPGVIVLLAVLAALVTTPAEAARVAALDELDTQNFEQSGSLDQLVSQSTQVVSFAIGGTLLLLLSPGWILEANAVSFVLSALLLVRLPLGTPQVSEQATSALRLIVASPVLRLLAVWSALAMTAATVMERYVAVYVKSNFPTQGYVLPLLVCLAPLTMLLYVAWSLKHPGGGLVRAFQLLLSGLMLAGIGLALPPTLLSATLAFIGAGLCFTFIAPARPLAAREAKGNLAGFIGTMQALLFAGASAMALAIGALSSRVGLNRALLLVVLSALVVTVGSWFAWRPAETSTTSPMVARVGSSL